MPCPIAASLYKQGDTRPCINNMPPHTALDLASVLAYTPWLSVCQYHGEFVKKVKIQNITFQNIFFSKMMKTRVQNISPYFLFVVDFIYFQFCTILIALQIYIKGYNSWRNPGVLFFAWIKIDYFFNHLRGSFLTCGFSFHFQKVFCQNNNPMASHV